MDFIIIYVTYSTKKEATSIINHLLKQKLIVCANLLDSKSFYISENKIKDTDEIISILKTKKTNWKKIKNEIKKLHSYKIPCIIKINIKTNKDYSSWILNNI